MTSASNITGGLFALTCPHSPFGKKILGTITLRNFTSNFIYDYKALGGIIHDAAWSSVLIVNSTLRNTRAGLGAIFYSEYVGLPEFLHVNSEFSNFSDRCGPKPTASIPVQILPSPDVSLPVSLLSNFTMTVLLMDNFGGIACWNYDTSQKISAQFFPMLVNSSQNWNVSSPVIHVPFTDGVASLEIPIFPRYAGTTYKGIISWADLKAEISFKTADDCPQGYKLLVYPTY
jgi:hypothetical protein